jgi:hypothetical protein
VAAVVAVVMSALDSVARHIGACTVVYIRVALSLFTLVFNSALKHYSASLGGHAGRYSSGKTVVAGASKAYFLVLRIV